MKSYYNIYDFILMNIKQYYEWKDNEFRGLLISKWCNDMTMNLGEFIDQ